MNTRTFLSLSLVLGINLATVIPSFAQTDVAIVPPTAAVTLQPAPDGLPHTFAVSGGQFKLDGKAFRVISGEMHYPRIPREYWRARL